jgi:farnesyl-diphosphate farnesyltransferase
MLTYEKRREWRGDLARMENLRDLEEYCYYVAGTVGHLLTDLFLREIGSVDGARRREMRRNAERFGLGLQMVNILKDQTDDREEGWCYVPKLLAADEGLAVADLFDPEHRDAAHRAVEPIFDRAREHLDAALDYVFAIPPDDREIRVACLLPLWLAVRTLVHARGNDAMFEPGAPVKITREEVESLAGDCMEHAADDEYLRRRYGELWRAEGRES